MNTINDNTKIPLYAALVSVPTFFGFVLWLSSIAFSANGSEKRIAELEQKQNNQNELLISIKEDLTLVKYKLEIKDRK